MFMAETGAPGSDLRGLVLGTIEEAARKIARPDDGESAPEFIARPRKRRVISGSLMRLPEQIFKKLEGGSKLEFAWIDDPDLEPADERTHEFLDGVKAGKTTDTVYLEQLEKLGRRASRRQIASVERALRDRVRLSQGLPPRVKPSVAERARELGFDPNYDLPRASGHRSRAHSDTKIQTLLYRESMEAKLSAIRES